MWIMVDVEADGPCPGIYSMTELGAIAVEPELNRTFYAQMCPITKNSVDAALASTNKTRQQTLEFPAAKQGMLDFKVWLNTLPESPMFISDNNGFDWQFVNYYFHHFLGHNPFGHSSTNLGSLYKGMVKSMRQNFKHLRKTKHTHHPVDDARGNAEALLEMIRTMGLAGVSML